MSVPLSKKQSNFLESLNSREKIRALYELAAYFASEVDEDTFDDYDSEIMDFVLECKSLTDTIEQTFGY